MAYKLNDVQAWKGNWESNSVQNNNATFGGDFLSSESLVVFAGPPAYSSADYTTMVPIGFVQSVQVSQQKQIQQLFEIGSRKPFFVPGRNVIGGGIGRILFDGPSLMYALYLRKAGADNTGLINPSAADGGPWTTIKSADYPTNPLPIPGGVDAGLGGEVPVSFKGANAAQPLPNYYFSNLGSSFFNRPTGLGFAMYDGEGQPYGGFYLENCYLQTYSFSVASQQTILMEQVSFRASSILPIKIT
jgi:hypothetical protein